MNRGQYIRLLVGTAANATNVIAAAKELSLHVSATVEDATTKDTDGMWTEQEITGLSYDISTSALVIPTSDDLAEDAVTTDFWENLAATTDGAVYWKIANVSGTNNRTVGTTIVSGQANLTSMTITAQNKQNTTIQANLQGVGAYTVGS